MKRRTPPLFLTLAVVAAAGCTMENAIVGGECVDGFVPAGDGCVPADTSAGGAAPDPSGAASAEPGPPRAGVPGGPRPTADGALPDGGARDGGLPDGGAPDGAAPDGGPDAGVDAGDLDAAADAPLDAPLDAPSDADLTADADAEADAPLVCSGGLTACGDQCVALDEDPRNCGACGKQCVSHICVAGECQGSVTGDVVVIGHDYANAWAEAAESRVLVNAVAIPTSNPLRILTFAGDAPLTSVGTTRTIITHGPHRRQVAITEAQDPAELTSPTLAAQFDVVLLHDAAGDDPAARGASWASSLGTFVTKGGVVIALDGGRTDMPQLLTSAQLLALAGHVKLAADARFDVTAPGDVVGAQVLSPYATSSVAVGFLGAPAPGATLTHVVRERADAGDGAPVVIHRVVRN